MSSAHRGGRWFLREPLPDPHARVFCLPYSGCGASMYWRWPVEHEGVNFCPVQFPGRENRLREPCVATYQELADLLVEQLAPYLDRPYGLFGHCSSALAAYETSARLVARGLPAPARLFVSSQVAPQDGPYGSFLELNDEQLAGELRSLFAGLGNSDPSPGFVDMVLGVLRQDIEVNRRYHIPDPHRLPCPITVIGWSADHNVAAHLMDGWSACGTTDRVTLEGGHYRFIEAPDALLKELIGGFAAAPAGALKARS